MQCWCIEYSKSFTDYGTHKFLAIANPFSFSLFSATFWQLGPAPLFARLVLMPPIQINGIPSKMLQWTSRCFGWFILWALSTTFSWQVMACGISFTSNHGIWAAQIFKCDFDALTSNMEDWVVNKFIQADVEDLMADSSSYTVSPGCRSIIFPTLHQSNRIAFGLDDWSTSWLTYLSHTHTLSLRLKAMVLGWCKY